MTLNLETALWGLVLLDSIVYNGFANAFVLDLNVFATALAIALNGFANAFV